jgi:hypothetical protein
MKEALFAGAMLGIALSWIARAAKKPDGFIRHFSRVRLCVILTKRWKKNFKFRSSTPNLPGEIAVRPSERLPPEGQRILRVRLKSNFCSNGSLAKKTPELLLRGSCVRPNCLTQSAL